MDMAFSNWLEKKYLEWQIKHGRKSVTEFSNWLGVERSLVTKWMNEKGRKPSMENTFILAQKLGMEVYAVLGLPRPDPLLFRLQALLDMLTEQERAAIEAALNKAELRGQNET